MPVECVQSCVGGWAREAFHSTCHTQRQWQMVEWPTRRRRVPFSRYCDVTERWDLSGRNGDTINVSLPALWPGISWILAKTSCLVIGQGWWLIQVIIIHLVIVVSFFSWVITGLGGQGKERERDTHGEEKNTCAVHLSCNCWHYYDHKIIGRPTSDLLLGSFRPTAYVIRDRGFTFRSPLLFA